MITDPTAVNCLAYRTIGCAINVHRVLGPGVSELPNALALAEELREAAISFRREIPVSLVYKGRRLGCCYRLDFLIEDTIIVELKSVREVIEVHKKQVLSYLRLTRRPLALLLNFNVPVLQQGISRFINDPTVMPSAIAHLGTPRELFQAAPAEGSTL